MSKYYDWQATFSRQTGTQGEICIVTGAKNIGKTFGLRLQCVNDYLKTGRHFCEICRTKDEVKNVTQGYFDKLQNDGFFSDYVFKVERNTGYIAEKPAADEKPEWHVICYFVALTAFQTEKKRTYTNVYRFIFDEAIIDRKDRYHRYLPNEFLVLANILDSVSRQQYEDAKPYKVYILGNACDLSCPYLQYLGVNSIPEYGDHFYRRAVGRDGTTSKHVGWANAAGKQRIGNGIRKPVCRHVKRRGREKEPCSQIRICHKVRKRDICRLGRLQGRYLLHYFETTEKP